MSRVSSIPLTSLLRRCGMAYISVGFGICLRLKSLISSILLSWKCIMPASGHKILMLLPRLKFPYLQDTPGSFTHSDQIHFCRSVTAISHFSSSCHYLLDVFTVLSFGHCMILFWPVFGSFCSLRDMCGTYSRGSLLVQ
jgi:hypothetical protein